VPAALMLGRTDLPRSVRYGDQYRITDFTLELEPRLKRAILPWISSQVPAAVDPRFDTVILLLEAHFVFFA